MLLSNLEYIPLRLARRYVFRDGLLLRLGGFFPYYRMNLNQSDPVSVVDRYARHLASVDFTPHGRRVLEIGVGRTNSVAYELAARFAPRALTVFEPFVGFAADQDQRLLLQVAARHHQRADALSAQVRRLGQLSAIPDRSVDLILSNSVLEHVGEPAPLFAELHRVLAPGGAMLHLVDYRDHFFKYPYHFLQFRKAIWGRWLNPGDLPVWRVYDHVEQLGSCGFSVRVLEHCKDDRAYAKIASHVSSDYRKADERVQTTAAVLWAVATERR